MAGENISTAGDVRPRRTWLKRSLPLAILAAMAGVAFALGFDKYLTFEALRDNRMLLKAFVEDRLVLAVAAYIVIYAISTAVSLPGGALLSVAGGFLFGAAFGTLYVVVGATIGATLVFLIARSALGSALRDRAGPFLQKMESGFRENAFNYLMVLRLIPLFPFFIVNLVPAFLGVTLRVFFVATFLGIIPGTFVYATVGAGLGSIFDSGEEFTAAGILTPEIVTALIGLAILALIPVAYKRFKARRA